MDALRKRHNYAKRQLISEWVKPNSYVLDCGCGRGGDWHKWKAVLARLVAIDPDIESIQEAKTRAQEIEFGVWFLEPGDIRQAVFAGPFDVVCYNFSIQYIVDSFEESIKAIKKSVRPGGYLIGTCPEKSRITKSPDSIGNTFEIHGDKLRVHLIDGPFYSDGPKDEPLLDGKKLCRALGPEFKCIVWKPLISEVTNTISDIYIQFVFLRNK
jgi:SAM-dependent methyltransferase